MPGGPPARVGAADRVGLASAASCACRGGASGVSFAETSAELPARVRVTTRLQVKVCAAVATVDTGDEPGRQRGRQGPRHRLGLSVGLIRRVLPEARIMPDHVRLVMLGRQGVTDVGRRVLREQQGRRGMTVDPARAGPVNHQRSRSTPLTFQEPPSRHARATTGTLRSQVHQHPWSPRPFRPTTRAARAPAPALAATLHTPDGQRHRTTRRRPPLTPPTGPTRNTSGSAGQTRCSRTASAASKI